MHRPGDIVLVPVPFSDLTSSKKRPVLIMSKDDYNLKSDDVICMAITSQIRGIKYEIIIDSEDMEIGQLPKESCIRVDKIYTLDQRIIVKKYGVLKNNKLKTAVENFEKLITE